MGAFKPCLCAGFFASVDEICLTCRQLVCHHIQFSGLYVRCSIDRMRACRHERNTNHHRAGARFRRHHPRHPLLGIPRLKLALRGKRLGLSLAEIKELIDMYDTVEDESTQLQSFLDVLAQRRAALEQQRDDIEAVLKEIARFERQCREMLKAEEPAAPTVRQPKRRTSGSG